MSLQQYYELFFSHVEVLREVGVSLAGCALIEAITNGNGHRVPNKKNQADAQD
jgi:hypothetical protein